MRKMSEALPLETGFCWGWRVKLLFNGEVGFWEGGAGPEETLDGRSAASRFIISRLAIKSSWEDFIVLSGDLGWADLFSRPDLA